MEGEIGRFRRRHLVPVPTVASLAELNELIAAGDLLDDDRVITGRPITIGAAFAAETPTLMGLPTEPFDPARLLDARVDNRAQSVCATMLLLGAGPLRRATSTGAPGRTDRRDTSTGPGWWPPTNGRSDVTSRC